jgi:pyruvate dehydrogenase E2 component (dihydrolipoamide acetyltransferase)
MFELKFNDIGEGINEGIIINWNYKVGDKVKEGDILVIVETDKLQAEITSPVTGTIIEICFKEQETVNVGDTLAKIE